MDPVVVHRPLGVFLASIFCVGVISLFFDINNFCKLYLIFALEIPDMTGKQV